MTDHSLPDVRGYYIWRLTEVFYWGHVCTKGSLLCLSNAEHTNVSACMSLLLEQKRGMAAFEIEPFKMNMLNLKKCCCIRESLVAASVFSRRL